MRFLIFCAKKIGKKTEQKAIEIRYDVEENSSYKNDTINNMLTFTMSGFGELLKENFKRQIVELSRKAISLVKFMSLSRYTGMMYNFIVVSTALIIGIYRISKSEMTIGQLYTITIFVQRLYAPIGGLSDSYMAINKSIPIVNKVTDLIENDDVVEFGNIQPVDDIQEIKCSKVCFHYSNSSSLLTALEFDIKKGQTLGILGENGIGKSTIIRLLTKKCKCDDGSIIIDKININDINIDYIYKQISVMNQDGNLLSGKVRDIINPFHLSVTDEKIYEVMGHLAFDVNKLSEGLDTVINPNMTNLSGGEKQKLNLARVILEDKPVVLLDEPTSALDIESETMICDFLKGFLSEKLAVIITHRKRILRICTSVIEL